MSIYFRRTDKEYYVLTNYPELVRRARELGYKGVSLFTQDELDESDIEQFKQINKSAIKILFRPDQKEEHGLMRLKRIEGTELHNITIELAGNETEEGERIETFEDAIEHFPKPVELEKWLKGNGIIRETEYYNRCGHCHEILGEDDKYCRYCGTERGKGEFLPFMNGMYCVYGPPVKMKYKCTACGHIWISGVLGGDNAKFCPQCGKKSLNVLEQRASWEQKIGCEEPYDTDERPILLKEDEIVKLLNERKFLKKRKENDDEIYIDREDILSALRKAGIDIPQKADYEIYPRTEKEGEQINLANIILRLKGNNPKGCKNNSCPHCRSEIVAALGYKVLGRNYAELDKSIHAPVGKDALVYNGHDVIYYNKPESRNIDHPAFICLKCGTEFGTLKLPKKLKILSKQLTKYFGKMKWEGDT